MLSERFRINGYIDLQSTSPFASKVITYPSIFAISTGKTDRVPVVTLDTASPTECASVMAAVRGSATSCPGVAVAEYTTWFEGDDPWVLSSPAHLAALRSLETRFLPMEQGGGTRVGNGVATGNDKIYIVGEGVDIERDRLVPIVMREDIEKGRIRDARRFVINTFGEDGKVVDLRSYPKLAAYLEDHASELKKRHIARKNTASWFRTIDRVYPERVGVEKLLVPDIARSNEIVYERGIFHPHHNLYFITSTEWDLEALGCSTPRWADPFATRCPTQA